MTLLALGRAPSDCSAGAPAGAQLTLTSGRAVVSDAPLQDPTDTTVTCTRGTIAPGDSTTCTATVVDTAPSARSTPTGTVAFTSSGTGAFTGSPCTLAGTGPAASCQVKFTTLERGAQAITAGYDGDAAHLSSAGSTDVTVALPANTKRCLATVTGAITAANGDRASFLGLAFTTAFEKPAGIPKGTERYRDDGPADQFRLRSTRIDALTCDTHTHTSAATVFGTATLTDGSIVEYRIDLTRGSRRARRDTYRLRLTNGYDSGTKPIDHGAVEILS